MDFAFNRKTTKPCIQNFVDNHEIIPFHPPFIATHVSKRIGIIYWAGQTWKVQQCFAGTVLRGPEPLNRAYISYCIFLSWSFHSFPLLFKLNQCAQLTVPIQDLCSGTHRLPPFCAWPVRQTRTGMRRPGRGGSTPATGVGGTSWKAANKCVKCRKKRSYVALFMIEK